MFMRVGKLQALTTIIPAHNTSVIEIDAFVGVGLKHKLKLLMVVASLGDGHSSDGKRGEHTFGGEIDPGMNFKTTGPHPVIVDMQEATDQSVGKIKITAVGNMWPHLEDGTKFCVRHCLKIKNSGLQAVRNRNLPQD